MTQFTRYLLLNAPQAYSVPQLAICDTGTKMAVVEAASLSLAQHLLPILLLLLAATNDATKFSITNNCSYTVWPATTPVGGGLELTSGGAQAARLIVAAAGHVKQLIVVACFPARRAVEPQTTVALAEFTIGGATDFLDLTMIDGFNLPMALLPAKEGPECRMVLRCEGNSNSQCPDAFMTPTDSTKTHTCPGNTDYEVVFCPPSDLKPMPAIVSPQPSGAARTRSSLGRPQW